MRVSPTPAQPPCPSSAPPLPPSHPASTSLQLFRARACLPSSINSDSGARACLPSSINSDSGARACLPSTVGHNVQY